MAAAPTRSRMAAFSRTWRTLVQLHRGDVAAATRDLAGADAARLAPIPYAALYVDQFSTHLAALAGRPLEALAVADRLIHAAREQNAMRFVGRGEVYRGWALSLLADPSALDALHEARETAATAGNPEPLGQGGLDIAVIHLDAGRPDAAASALDEVADVLRAGAQVSNAWRIELRAHYLRGRLALLVGDAAAATEAAETVIVRARLDAIDRYEVLGASLGVEAAAVAGEKVAVEDVMTILPALLASARPEAWRVAARLGNALDADALRYWSAERVDVLAASSGEYGEQIKEQAAAVLSSGR